MKAQRACSLFMLAVALAACTQNQAPNETLQRKIDVTQREIASMKARLSTLQQSVAALQTANQWRTFADEVSGIAYLTPADSGYSVIKFDQGYISVALVNVRPYANGTQITLRFGNPTSATLTGVTMTLDWGETKANGYADNTDAKSRDVKLLNSLPAGSWTQERFVLDSIPASKLGFVRIKNFSHQGIILLKRY